MPIPSSDRRLTRGQVRLDRVDLSFSSPAPDDSASSRNQLALVEPQTAHKVSTSAERGRRKVLAELAGNDSPIVGLIPGLRDSIACRTPFSDIRSAVSIQSCFKKPSPLPDEFNGTPIGESLLRSQVQLLLQKVEADAPSHHKPAPSLRALCHLHRFTDSPALKFVAPTPINTPCDITIPSSDQLQDARIPLTKSTLSVQTSVLKSYKPAQNLRHNDWKLLVQSPGEIISPDKMLSQHQANVLGVHASGINLVVDLSISPDVQENEPPQHLVYSLPKTFESGHATVTNSVVSGKDHQIMQTSPLISKVLDEAEPEILGKKTTRVLQFDSPDKSSATQTSSPSMLLLGDSLTNPMRELEEDEASQWSVIVNVSSPEGNHEDVDVAGEDSADSAYSFHGGDCSVHEHVLKSHKGNRLELLWSMPRKGTPFRRAEIIEDEEEEEEVEAAAAEAEADSVERLARDEDASGSLNSREVEQCQILLNDLTVEAVKQKRA